ncbi:hypothetical protein J2Z42_002436 [Clostridium algifaecis]|uniref:Lipoprotein n=1 Tax=Clostridium algifaecis TaxID=1472040 RepID=A0ABS4KXX0_9CLOT|nr:hypothetical protein [Clostridium algifaecis]MBP2033729.1 hypothetical protein [Clostridium algifaecis]
MKKSFKKLGVIAVILALFVSFTACSFGKSSTSNAQKTTQNAKKDQEPKITVNESKTAQLKKEKSLMNGKVYVQNNRAIATMVVKSGVSDSEVKTLAQKYAKELKTEYKSIPVSVMAVRDNKNVANVTIK